MNLRIHRVAAALGLTSLLVIAPASLAGAQEDNGDADGFTLTGERVSGGHNAGDSVQLLPGDSYVDSFSESTLYYRIPRQIENSSVHVGIMNYSDDPELEFSMIQVELGTWESERCSRENLSYSELNTRNRVRSVQLLAAPNPDVPEEESDPCGDASELVLTVNSTEASQDAVGEDFEILIYEEPQPGNASDYLMDPNYDDLAWQDMGRDVANAISVEPGTSVADATALEAGNTYDINLSPGDVQVFSVPVEWGEWLQAEAFFPEGGEALSEQLSGMGNVSLATLSPLAGVLHGESNALLTSQATQLRTATTPIAWNNRYLGDGNMVSLAGTYYLVVVADDHDDGASFDIPYRLTVGTVDYGTEIPDYPQGADTNPNVVAAGGSGDAEDDEDDSASAGGGLTGGSGTGVWVLVGIGALGLLLMATGGFFLLRSFNRSRSPSVPY